MSRQATAPRRSSARPRCSTNASAVSAPTITPASGVMTSPVSNPVPMAVAATVSGRAPPSPRARGEMTSGKGWSSGSASSRLARRRRNGHSASRRHPSRATADTAKEIHTLVCGVHVIVTSNEGFGAVTSQPLAYPSTRRGWPRSPIPAALAVQPGDRLWPRTSQNGLPGCAPVTCRAYEVED